MLRRPTWRVIVALSFMMLAAGACSASQESKEADDWEARCNALQPPEMVMDTIGVVPGWTVAEIGAGRGRYAVHMARRVGPTGKVFANDIDEKSLEYLEYRCERDSVPNIVTILGEITDPSLPPASCDMIYVINSYHHFDDPVELMRNALPALVPGGILVIIEHDPEKAPSAGEHSTARELVIEQMEEAGCELLRIHSFLELDNIYVFRPRPVGAPQ